MLPSIDGRPRIVATKNRAMKYLEVTASDCGIQSGVLISSWLEVNITARVSLINRSALGGAWNVLYI